MKNFTLRLPENALPLRLPEGRMPESQMHANARHTSISTAHSVHSVHISNVSKSASPSTKHRDREPLAQHLNAVELMSGQIISKRTFDLPLIMHRHQYTNLKTT